MHSFLATLGAIVRAAVQVRVWLLGWLVVTVPAVLLTWPLLEGLHQALDHQPAATFGLGQSLDADLARLHPDLVIRSIGAPLLALLGWTFLGGGVLTMLGGPGRVTLAGFLAACGRTLPRNLRALAIGLLLALLLDWGVGVFDTWLRREALRDINPAAPLVFFLPSWPLLSVGAGLEALRWLYGFLFLLLLYASKVARAHLCCRDRTSAVLAWCAAAGTLLRRPLHTLTVIAVLTAAWALPQFAVGELLALGDDEADLPWMTLIGQALVAWLQILLVAAFFVARAAVTPAAPALSQNGTAKVPGQPALS
jgi:hypothetical protein